MVCRQSRPFPTGPSVCQNQHNKVCEQSRPCSRHRSGPLVRPNGKARCAGIAIHPEPYRPSSKTCNSLPYTHTHISMHIYGLPVYPNPQGTERGQSGPCRSGPSVHLSPHKTGTALDHSHGHPIRLESNRPSYLTGMAWCVGSSNCAIAPNKDVCPPSPTQNSAEVVASAPNKTVRPPKPSRHGARAVLTAPNMTVRPPRTGPSVYHNSHTRCPANAIHPESNRQSARTHTTWHAGSPMLSARTELSILLNPKARCASSAICPQ